MFTQIKKRDGRVVEFTDAKITDAIFKAAKAVGGEDRQTAMELTLEVMKLLKKQYNGDIFSVEDVQDTVEKVLIETGHARTAKAYILYRAKRTRFREAESELMDAVEEILVETSRENANVSNSPSAKMLQIASAASRKYYLSRLIPEEFSQAHSQGDIHIHDLDFYGKTLTCLQIPLGDLLQKGFDNGHGYIRPPKRPASATALAAIILQSCQNDMHGGQSFPYFDRDMAPYVSDASEDETFQAMEALIYNLNSMHSLGGEERIWVYDKKTGNMRSVTMADFHHVFELGRYQALSLNYTTGKTEMKDITASWKHQNVNKLARIKLKSGQSVVVTDNHSMMAIDEQGDVTVSSPIHLKAGLIPRKLQLTQASAPHTYDLSGYPLSTKHPLERLQLNPALAKFLGYYVAEGSVDGSTIYLALFNKELEKEAREILKQLNPTFETRLRYDRQGRPRDLACNVGQRFAAFIADQAGKGAGNKHVPTEIFFAEESVIKAFLDGYFSGDGTVGSNRLTACTTSKELRDGLQLLAARLEKPCTIREDETPRSNFDNARKKYLISIGGAYTRDLAVTGKNITLVQETEKEQTPYDYEWLRPLIKEVLGVNGWMSSHYRITPQVIDGLVQDLEQRLAKINMERISTLGSQDCLLEVIRQAAQKIKTTEKYHLLKQVNAGRLPAGTKYFPVLADYAGTLDTLYLPAHRDKFILKNTQQSPRAVIRWAGLVKDQACRMNHLLAVLKRCQQLLPLRVKDVSIQPHEEYVYDISVADNENFLTSESVFVHNSRAGAQVPFSSLNLGCETGENARKVTRNLLLAYDKGLGRGENPIFPNIIFRLKEGLNLNPGDPNYDLFQLAIRVASRRMNPTFSFMDASFNKPYGTDVGYMGCRTRVMSNCQGPEITERRGNLSFTTLNLPRLAIKARGNTEAFFRDLERVVDLTARQLYHRFQVQSRLKVRDMPFLMGQGLYLDSEGLGPNDPIGDAIVHGTLSIGFIGLAEALITLTGQHHGQSADSQQLGVEIISCLRKLVDRATAEYNLNYSLLATPAEGLSGRFVSIDREEFGGISGVTDKEYYTNSFHIPVGYPITIFDKIAREGPYHKFANAGHISYIEFSSPPLHNQEAVEDILRQMQACDMGYAGINFPIDFCMGCGHLGVIDESCPVCSSTAIRRVRRITGYLSTVDRFNDAKQSELRDRKAHRLN
ncbi:MAG: anaerobic ribonucleoside-triphosphate reductase [Bacillota bacterium]